MGGDKEDDRSCCQKLGQSCSNFGNFLYRKGTDKDGNTVGLVIGRSCGSWARIGLFYLGFYGFLAGFFAAMLIVFLSTINPATEVGLDREKAGPKLVQFLADNDLDVAPGLNWVNILEPLPKVDEEDPVKKAEAIKNADIQRRTKFVNKTQGYINGFDYGPTSVACPEQETPYTEDVPCKPDLKSHNCSAADGFGYDNNKPCFFIKINKVWGWTPQEDGSLVLRLDCGSDANVLNGGFQKSGFPFFGQKVYQTPPAIVQVDLNNHDSSKFVKCKLVGKGVVPSDSFNPSRSFGAIELEVPCLGKACK